MVSSRHLYLIATGMLLVIAAVVKANEWRDSGVDGLALEYVFMVTAIVVEFAIGIWCLFFAKRHPIATIWCLVIIFLAFSTYQLSKLLSGHSSCGCFGALEVHPAIVFLLDVGIASVGLTFLRSLESHSKTNVGRLSPLFR